MKKENQKIPKKKSTHQHIHTGYVLWFGGYNYEQEKDVDYGFISHKHFGELFFHRKSIFRQQQSIISEHDHLYVSFKTRNSKKGKSAILVRPIELQGWIERGKNTIIVWNKKRLPIENNHIQFFSKVQHEGFVTFYLNTDLSPIHIKPLKSPYIPRKAERWLKNNKDPSLISMYMHYQILQAEDIESKRRCFLEGLKNMGKDFRPLIHIFLHQFAKLMFETDAIKRFIQESHIDYCMLLCTILEDDTTQSHIQQELIRSLQNVLPEDYPKLHSYSIFSRGRQYKGPLWKYATRSHKIEVMKQYFSSFWSTPEKIFYNLKTNAKKISFDWENIFPLDPDSLSLCKLWVNDNATSFQKAKMLSARGAELVAKRHYCSLQYTVTDKAIEQISPQNDGIWKLGDLMLDNQELLDVKNARNQYNATTYSEFCVPRFKEHRNSRDVKIVGVLSPYLQETYLLEGEANFSTRLEPTVLGECSHDEIRVLYTHFNQKNLNIVLHRNQNSSGYHYLPPWIFDYNEHFYRERQNCIDALRQKEIPTWEETLMTKGSSFENGLFLALILYAKREIPSCWRENIPNWILSFYEILNALPLEQLRLPGLFLSILRHFLDCLAQPPKDYRPMKYIELWTSNLHHHRRKTYPMFIYDPLDIIEDFCLSLEKIWEYRETAKLTEYSSFTFHGRGLLSGRKNDTSPSRTLLAYCGGFIEGKGSCGYSPLIIGVHKTCTICRRLICPKCSYCSNQCDANSFF